MKDTNDMRPPLHGMTDTPFHRASASTGPITTYNGFVWTWDCDQNGHYNATCYIRAFQIASEAFALAVTGRNPQASTARCRHIRYHREILDGDAMTIRSGLLKTGEWAGAIVHLMESGGRVCATALDHPGYELKSGAVWNDADVAMALPRGVPGAPDEPPQVPDPTAKHAIQAMVGIVGPTEIDSNNRLFLNEAFGHCALSCLHLLEQVGFSPKWRAESGDTHMTVELKITAHDTTAAADGLLAYSWLSATGPKSFSIRHLLTDHKGRPLVSSEQVNLCVNVASRRSTAPPDFITGNGRTG